MSSTGDDASDRSNDASDETGSVASSSEYDSDDEDSDDASDDDDDESSDDGDASSEESDDEEDNQAKEVAEQKAKAVQDDVASILMMASSMDKICRRLQFKYGSNRKAPNALEPNPAKDEAKDEVPEALTPPKPTDLLPPAEPPRKVMSDAATDSNDLETKSVVEMDVTTEPAAPATFTALSKEAEHLMRNIEVQGKPKPVVPHIEKDCQLQLALATEPSLHLQEYMHPPPLLELPKRPRPFLATSSAPLRALSSVHVPKLPSSPPSQEDAGDQSVPPELSESTACATVPTQRTQTSKHEEYSRQEPSPGITGRTDFAGQVDSPRRVVSDATTDSSDLEPSASNAVPAVATTRLIDRGVATTEPDSAPALAKDAVPQPAAAKKRATEGPPSVVHLQPERHASQHPATPRSTVPSGPTTSVPTPRPSNAALPWSALQPAPTHPETPDRTPVRFDQPATSAEPDNRSLVPPPSVSRTASVRGEVLEHPESPSSHDETMSNNPGEPSTRLLSPTTIPSPMQQTGSDVVTPLMLHRTGTGASAAESSATNSLQGPETRYGAPVKQARAPVGEAPTKAKISPSSTSTAELPATKGSGPAPNNTTPTPISSPGQPQRAPTSVAAPQERLLEETLAASPLQETVFTATDGNGDEGAPPESQVPAEDEEELFFDHGGDEASSPDDALLSATQSPRDTVAMTSTETAPKASLPAAASVAGGAPAQPEMSLTKVSTKPSNVSDQLEQRADQQPMRRQSSTQQLPEKTHLNDGGEPARASASLVAQASEVSPRIEAPAVQLQNALAPEHERSPLPTSSEVVIASAASSSEPSEVVPSTVSPSERAAVSSTVSQVVTGSTSVALDEELVTPATHQVAAAPATLSQTTATKLDVTAQPRPSSSTNMLSTQKSQDVYSSEPPTMPGATALTTPVAPASSMHVAPASVMPAVLASAMAIAPVGATSVEPAPSTTLSLQGLMASGSAGPTVYATSRAAVPTTPLASAPISMDPVVPIPASSSSTVEPVSMDQPIITARRRSSSVTTPDPAWTSRGEVQPLPRELPPNPRTNPPKFQDQPANSGMNQPLPQDRPSDSRIDPFMAFQRDAAPLTTEVETAFRRPSMRQINTMSTTRRPSSIVTTSTGPNTIEDTNPAADDPLSPPAVTPPAAFRPQGATPTPTPPSTSYNFQVFASTPTALPTSSLGHNPSVKQPTSPLGSYSPPMPSPRTMTLETKLPLDVEINAMHYLLFGSRKPAAP